MEKIFVVLAVMLMATLMISGCVQQAPPSGGPPTTGKLTQEQAEQQAMNELENELDEAVGNVTLENLENELLQQG